MQIQETVQIKWDFWASPHEGSKALFPSTGENWLLHTSALNYRWFYSNVMHSCETFHSARDEPRAKWESHCPLAEGQLWSVLEEARLSEDAGGRGGLRPRPSAFQGPGPPACPDTGQSGPSLPCTTGSCCPTNGPESSSSSHSLVKSHWPSSNTSSSQYPPVFSWVSLELQQPCRQRTLLS